jgi:protocatechuate 3,4-dioxygenase beta subunit
MILVSTAAWALFPEPVSARSQILFLSGKVVDVNGDPIREARVEIWQTDAFGVYDHPGDSNTARRDRGFQFYGNSTVDGDGEYLFRTVLPGKYEPRPMHIHVKVWRREKEILTTQFYFAVDNSDYGGAPSDLRVRLQDGGPDDANYTALFDLVVDTAGARGNLKTTRSQAEGPYYPVAKVIRYDNDLAHVD